MACVLDELFVTPPAPIERFPPASVNEPVALFVKTSELIFPTGELFVLVPLVPAYSTAKPLMGEKLSCQLEVVVQFPLPAIHVAAVA